MDAGNPEGDGDARGTGRGAQGRLGSRSRRLLLRVCPKKGAVLKIWFSEPAPGENGTKMSSVANTARGLNACGATSAESVHPNHTHTHTK